MKGGYIFFLSSICGRNNVFAKSSHTMDELELIIYVDTADAALMTIFVFPRESARLGTENKRLELKYEEVFGDFVKERTVFDGDVNYWPQ